jgi:hypothetical protein
LDAKAAFGDVTDLEALTAMLKDMNVRGATAFALLVQNADEYKASVEDLANSTGEATQMADIQQQSLVMQMQRVKNALLAPFLLADTIGEAQGSLNEFTLRIKELVDQFTEFFIIIGADGQETYSEHGKALKEFVIVALNEAVEIIQLLKNAFLEQNASISNMGDLLRLATMPLKMLLKVLDALGPNALKMVVVWKAFNALLPITNILTMVQTFAQTKLWLAMSNANVEGAKQVTIFSALMPITAAATAGAVGVTIAELTMAQSIRAGTAALWEQSMGWAGWWGAATAGLAVVVLMGAAIYKLASPIQAIAIALIAGAAAWYAYNGAMTMGVGVAAGIAATAVGIAALKQFFPKHADTIGSADEYAAMKFNKSRNYDGGGTYIPTYDNGGMSTEHGMAIVQKGETIVPKTQNMLGSGGITLNMGDVSVHDGEDFAERVAAALPDALRRVNDSGAI